MKLKEFILLQIEALQNGKIESAEFRVYLDEEGNVVSTGMTSINFTITL